MHLKPNSPPPLAFQNQVTAELTKSGILSGQVTFGPESRNGPAALAGQLATQGPVAFILAVFLASWGSLLFVDPRLDVAAGFSRGLVTLRPVLVPAGFAPQVLLLSLFAAYLPWSHMTHFFAKYFTWHSVRWDDAPNVAGRYDRRVQKLLLLPITWSARHIKGGDS